MTTLHKAPPRVPWSTADVLRCHAIYERWAGKRRGECIAEMAAATGRSLYACKTRYDGFRSVQPYEPAGPVRLPRYSPEVALQVACPQCYGRLWDTTDDDIDLVCPMCGTILYIDWPRDGRVRGWREYARAKRALAGVR